MTASTPGTADPDRPEPVSVWAPFGYRSYALLWTATLISNIGTWMHDVGAGWLMTTLDPTPAIVALVQAATTLPIFLFALLAGALADRVDKRRYLIVINIGLTVVVSALAILTQLGWVTPGRLLVITLLIGTGAAFMAPAWQAIVPALVPRAVLPSAIAVNSMGVNISRAIGPALAGFLITAIGLAAPFVLNALSHLVILAALWAWKPPPAPERTLPPEPLFGAMLTGLRHASRNGPLKATLLRAFGFFVFASAYWALLPLVARGLPGGGAELYGMLLAAIGAGAVCGALVLPRLKARIDSDRLVAGGTIIAAAAMGLLGWAPSPAVAILAAGLGGLGWIGVLTSLNLSAQTALPNWVRARGLAIMLMVFFGCMAAGATLWGQVATWLSIPAALSMAAVGAVVAIPLTWRAKLGQGEGLDLSPAMSWDPPVLAADVDPAPDRGPVLVTVTYEIDPADEPAFLAAMAAMSGERYRTGAQSWGIHQDAADARRWVEWFFLPSWAEHMRQHERVTHADRMSHDRVRSFHRGSAPPVVGHFLAPRSSMLSDA